LLAYATDDLQLYFLLLSYLLFEGQILGVEESTL
jgi:hypothetical protein